MKTLILVLLLLGCGDNNVPPADAGPDAVGTESVDLCCLYWPRTDAIRQCVTDEIAGQRICKRLNCLVWDEWICPDGKSALSIEETEPPTCMCEGF